MISGLVIVGLRMFYIVIVLGLYELNCKESSVVSLIVR